MRNLNTISTFIFLLLGSISMMGCMSFVTFDSQRPVEIDNRFFGKGYHQNGRSLDLDSLITGLGESKSTKNKMENLDTLHDVTQIILPLSAVMLGYYASPTSSNESTRSTALTAGYVIFGGSLVATYYLHKGIREAVLLHNSSFKKSQKSSSINFSPYVIPNMSLALNTADTVFGIHLSTDF